MNRIIGIFALVLLAINSTACGGGGGGSSQPFYGGIWHIEGIKVIDDCNLGAPPVVTNQITVNQSGSRVVVDSGRLVFTGETNDEDGFDVFYFQRDANGCETGSSYKFTEASGGEAIFGWAVISQCGRLTCGLAYGGIATRIGTPRSLELEDPLSLEDLLETLPEYTSGLDGEFSNRALVEQDEFDPQLMELVDAGITAAHEMQ